VQCIITLVRIAEIV